MNTRDRHVWFYRRLITLYPQPFRDEYADDMVMLFEDMLRDGSSAAVWQRTLRDVSKSVLVQRLEKLMSEPRARLAGVMTFVCLGIAVTGLLVAGTGPLTFLVPVGISFIAACMALAYWSVNRSYIEPADRMHQYWLRFLGSGAALLIAAVIATNVLHIDGPWELLIGDVIVGWALVGLGGFLGVWHGAYRMRAMRAA